MENGYGLHTGNCLCVDLNHTLMFHTELRMSEFGDLPRRVSGCIPVNGNRDIFTVGCVASGLVCGPAMVSMIVIMVSLSDIR